MGWVGVGWPRKGGAGGGDRLRDMQPHAETPEGQLVALAGFSPDLSLREAGPGAWLASGRPLAPPGPSQGQA